VKKNLNNDYFLEVKGLKTHFFTDEGVVKAVDGADFGVRRGKTLCIVGESGCGKSITARSILQLITNFGKIVEGEILLSRDLDHITNLAKLKPRSREMQSIRGREISMVFQEPMSSLSPVHSIGDQIIEAIRLHFDLSKEQARERAVDLLEKVGIPKAKTRLNSYVFELSGGMRQRAMIAMALSCEPKLLIADEPTTALDVTTQANILDLIKKLQKDLNMTIIFITHDLGVVAEIADDVVVMYLGKTVEYGDVDTIFHNPKHPYTSELLQSIPKISKHQQKRLNPISGMVPHPFARPKGCDFHPRCSKFMEGSCNKFQPPTIQLNSRSHVRCLLYK